jgi:hypothetical protein
MPSGCRWYSPPSGHAQSPAGASAAECDGHCLRARRVDHGIERDLRGLRWLVEVVNARKTLRSRGTGKGRRFLTVTQAKSDTNVSFQPKKSYIVHIRALLWLAREDGRVPPACG